MKLRFTEGEVEGEEAAAAAQGGGNCRAMEIDLEQRLK